jgi:hypothetical protein
MEFGKLVFRWLLKMVAQKFVILDCPTCEAVRSAKARLLSSLPSMAHLELTVMSQQPPHLEYLFSVCGFFGSDFSHLPSQLGFEVV